MKKVGACSIVIGTKKISELSRMFVCVSRCSKKSHKRAIVYVRVDETIARKLFFFRGFENFKKA